MTAPEPNESESTAPRRVVRRANVQAAADSTKESAEPGEKTCFVIAPISSAGSEIRKRSDQVLKYVIAPAVKRLGYKAIRADHIADAGLITTQVIQHIVESPLVVADLTGANPNVYYELALRHALRKPFIQIIAAGEQLPFDVAQQRTIEVDHHDLDSVAAAVDAIERQGRTLQDASPDQIESPLSVAVELQALRRSDNPVEQANAEIMAMLQRVARNTQVTRNFMKDLNDSEELQTDLRTLQEFVVRMAAQARFGVDELESLITQETSVSFDEWVRRTQRAMPDVGPSPWDYSEPEEEPPF